VGVVGDAVDDGGGQAGVGEGLAPFGERGVAGDRDRGAFFAFGEDLEQKFGGALVEVDVPELVDGQQVEASVAGDGLGQVQVVGCFGEFVGELGAGDVADAVPVLGRGDARADQQMGFAGLARNTLRSNCCWAFAPPCIEDSTRRRWSLGIVEHDADRFQQRLLGSVASGRDATAANLSDGRHRTLS
jgi:hypothetical protein